MYLDFNELSQQIKFVDLLNHLNIPFQTDNGYLKTDKAVISEKKNQFFYKDTKKGGSVINFYSDHADCTLREAAEYLKKTFIAGPVTPKREIPDLELHYTKQVESLGISEAIANEFEIGYAKKGIMKGKIAFLVRDENGQKVGYVGKEVKKDGWFYPKAFNAGNIVYNLYRANTDYVILVTSPLDVLYLHSIGFSYCCSLLGKGASDNQIQLLNRFRRILYFSSNPDNVINRLSVYSFVKAPVLTKPIIEHSEADIRSFFK